MDCKGILAPILSTWVQKSTLLLQNRGHAEVLKKDPFFREIRNEGAAPLCTWVPPPPPPPPRDWDQHPRTYSASPEPTWKPTVTDHLVPVPQNYGISSQIIFGQLGVWQSSNDNWKHICSKMYFSNNYMDFNIYPLTMNVMRLWACLYGKGAISNDNIIIIIINDTAISHCEQSPGIVLDRSDMEVSLALFCVLFCIDLFVFLDVPIIFHNVVNKDTYIWVRGCFN